MGLAKGLEYLFYLFNSLLIKKIQTKLYLKELYVMG